MSRVQSQRDSADVGRLNHFMNVQNSHDQLIQRNSGSQASMILNNSQHGLLIQTNKQQNQAAPLQQHSINDSAIDQDLAFIERQLVEEDIVDKMREE